MKNRLYWLGVLLALLSPSLALAQAQFATPDGVRVPGAVLECATNISTVAVPCGTNSAPLSVAISNLSASQAITGSVTTVAPAATVADCSVVTTVAGTAVLLVASGTARKSVVIQNLGNVNAGVSLTSAAPIIGSAQTFTLSPLASMVTPASLSLSGAIYGVGGAAGQVLACTAFQ